MRRLIWPVLFLFLFIIQGATGVFYSGWFSADLPLLGVYAYSILRGPQFGGMTGAAVGFLEDAMLPGVFGYHILTRAITGYGTGHLKGKIFKDNFIYHLPTIFVISLLLRFIYFFIALAIKTPVSSLGVYAIESLGFACGNMLFVIPVIRLVNYVYEWIKQEDISY